MMFFSPSPTPCGGSDLLLGETYTLLSHFDDSLPAYEAFCFDIEEKSSGSTTSHSDHSLPDYEEFSFDVDHIKEKSSGNTTSHSDLSLLEYESFHFDLSIDPLPPIDRSDSHLEEFADELAHIISPPEYNHFYFDLEDIKIPSDESKAHIEVLSVLWGNKLPILDGSLPLSSRLKGREIPSDESKVHIEVLSVLWGNRLPILDGLLPLGLEIWL
ncbi:hypothetical protein Tco_0209918 [Tanacetum coccineum]